MKREWIGGRVATLLNHYFRPDDPDMMSAAIGKDWADVLEGLPQDAIQRACVRYLRDEPRRKPTPGDIYRLAKLEMPRPEIVPLQIMSREQAEANRARAAQVNPERAAQAETIINEVFGLKKFGGKADE